MHAISRKPIAVAMAIALCLVWLTPVHAQTISGQIFNSSLWEENIQGPPGDGDHHGFLMLGIWVAEEGKFSTPLSVAPMTNATALPLPYGPYPFSIGPVTGGQYLVVAWIDGNTNGLYDSGEPYGEAGVEIKSSSVAGIALSLVDDNDNDSLPDWWEYHWFRFTPKPFEQTGTGDPDKDGLPNSQEANISLTVPGMDYLNPGNWDTDGDSMDDGWEVKYYSEEHGMGTDPCQPDGDQDLDGDSLSNWQEYCGVDRYPPRQANRFINGIYEARINSQTTDDLNPLDIDTDYDLLIDSFEAAWYDPASGIDPKSGPSQTIPSVTNVNTSVACADPDQDGLSNYREQCLLMELREGSTNEDKWVWSNRIPFPMLTYYNAIDNKLTRICYMSFSGDNLPLGLDPNAVLSSSENRAALRAHAWTDPTDGTGYDYVDENIPPGNDTDNDWLPDGWEVEFNLDPRDDGITGLEMNGPFGDPDDDSLLNIEEYFGQDGNRFTTRPFINGTGDETNPNEYNHRPDSTYTWRWYPTNILVNAFTDPRPGTGISRAETMGGAFPSLNIGTDSGKDSDDDGLTDSEEMSPSGDLKISSPVDSCDPFIPRSILIMSSNGIPIPDPEPAAINGIVPAGSREDLQRRDWTLECYVKLLATNLTGDLFFFRTKAGSSGRTVYQLSLSNNVPGIVSQNDAGSIKSVRANSLPTNRWVHVAAVWNHAKNSLGLYIDGVLYMSTSPVGECFSRFMFPATNRLALAVSPNGSFVGNLMLDEVRIWGVPRSSTQIATFANRLVPPHNGDDVWLNTESTEYYTHADSVIVNGGSLFDGEPGAPLGNVCNKDGNYWIDNGDSQYNAAKDVLLKNDGSLREGLAGTLIANAFWNDKDGDGVFSRDSLLAYYRFDDGGKTAEDFARRAKSGLIGSTAEEYLFGDCGYALPTNAFTWVSNDAPPVYGVDKRGADDSDGDGMPDAWERVWHLDPWDNGAKDESAPGMQDGPGGHLGDPDHDGLKNIYEFWAGTNPQSEDSDGNGTFDSQEDRDGDGVLNITEQLLRSRPDMVDTDDDGSPDNEEQGTGTSPAEPTDPSLSRAVTLGGAPDDYLEVPLSIRQRLTDWTIEAWVNPSNAVDGAGIIIRRVVQNLASGTAVNYIMGLETNGTSSLNLYAGYVWPDGRRFILSGGAVTATGSWTHVAARYTSGAAQLNLFTNGGLAATTNTFYDAPPVSGKGGDTFLRIGEDFAGSLDEVRLWTTVRDENQIKYGISKVVSGDDIASLACYFRFDDGEANTNSFPWSEFHQPGGFQDFTYSSDWNQQWRHAARRHGNVNIATNGAIIPPPTLRVLLSPEAAKTAGAQWSVDGGTWLNSGDTAQGLTPGDHTLMCRAITGWMEPPQETITLTNGMATTLTRTYLQKAALTVSIQLEGIGQTSNAFWRVDGSAWQTSASTVSNLNPGAHTLEFSDLPGWIKPSLETVVLNPGQSLAITRLYSIMYGTVRSILLPASAVTAGAQWRIDNGTWQNSGEAIGNLALTTHIIDFRSIPMWQVPVSISITLTNEQTVVVTGSYVQVTGLYVDITPPAAIADGALWRLNGGAWTNSGTFLELTPGTYTVSFSVIDDWLPPATVSAVVVSQSVTTVSGTYYRMDVFGGEAGTAPGQFTGPRAIAIGSLHQLYVADTLNSRIQKYDALSQTWTNWGQQGTNVGQFNLPGGIAVDPAGNVYVADSNNNRIQKRASSNGQWRAWGAYGTNIGSFVGPSDVAVDSAGNVYVADLYRNRVQKLGTNNTWSLFIDDGTLPGYVRNPKGLFIDSSDNLYVSDDGTQTNGSSRIQKFSMNGAFLQLLGSSSPSQGLLRRPSGMALGDTSLYVADIDNSRIAASSTSTVWTTILGSNVLDHAEDVAWDTRGFLLVADTGHNRILRLPVIPGVETNFTVQATGMMNPDPGTNTSFTITWFGILNWYYAVEYANNLTNAWQILPGCVNIPGQNTLTNCTDYSVGGVTSRFYRVLSY